MYGEGFFDDVGVLCCGVFCGFGGIGVFGFVCCVLGGFVDFGLMFL